MPARVITEGYGTGTNLLITEGFGIDISAFVEPVCIVRAEAKTLKASVGAKIIVSKRNSQTATKTGLEEKTTKSGTSAKVTVTKTGEKITIVREVRPCE